MKPTLAKPYTGQDPAGMLMSEKLDGVRAIWDGARLLSRNGNPFPAPAEWLAGLPSLPLDGELWIGRGRFQETLSAVKRGDFSRIRYLVFDSPGMPGPFSSRIQAISARGRSCEPHPHEYCAHREHLDAYFARIIAAGGEGVMLRNPAAPYTHGRTADLLKYKPFEDDEGQLVSTDPGQGQFAGMIGALIIRWRKHLVRIGSGLTNDMRANPPAIGSTVTFRFIGLTDAGIPRHAHFLAVRDYE
jgi:DNA ligase-1